MKRAHKKSSKKGGSKFMDSLRSLGEKIKHEFTDSNSALRTQFHRDKPLRKTVIPIVASALAADPGPVGTTAKALGLANEVAYALGYGRKQKWVKYKKSKSHGKRKSK